MTRIRRKAVTSMSSITSVAPCFGNVSLKSRECGFCLLFESCVAAEEGGVRVANGRDS